MCFPFTYGRWWHCSKIPLKAGFVASYCSNQVVRHRVTKKGNSSIIIFYHIVLAIAEPILTVVTCRLCLCVFCGSRLYAAQFLVPMGLDVTVHEFVTDGLTPPNADAIYLGQEAVTAAVDQIGWRAPLSEPSPTKLFNSALGSWMLLSLRFSVHRTTDPISVDVCVTVGSSWWTLPSPPPRIHLSTRPISSTRHTTAAVEWGEPPSLDIDDLFDTHALDNFQSTDLSELIIPPRYRPLPRKRKLGMGERDRSLLPSSPKRKKSRRGFLSSDTDDPASLGKPPGKIARTSTPPIILVPSTLPLRRSPSSPGEDDISDALSIRSIIPLVCRSFSYISRIRTNALCAKASSFHVSSTTYTTT